MLLYFLVAMPKMLTGSKMQTHFQIFIDFFSRFLQQNSYYLFIWVCIQNQTLSSYWRMIQFPIYCIISGETSFFISDLLESIKTTKYFKFKLSACQPLWKGIVFFYKVNQLFETLKITQNFWIFISVQFSCSVVSKSLRPHELQQARPPYPSPIPGVHSNSRP